MDDIKRSQLTEDLRTLFTRLKELGYLSPETAEPPATATGGSGQ